MKRFSKFIITCLFVLAIFAMKLDAADVSAQTAPEAAVATAGPAAHEAEAAHPLVSQSALAILYIGPVPESETKAGRHVPSILAAHWPARFVSIPVTNSMVCTWIAAAFIFLIVRLTTWKVKEIPSAGQNAMEAIVEGWQSLMGNVLEPKVTRWVFPLATTYLIFIVISNLMDLMPGVGSIGMGFADKGSSLPFAVEHVNTPFFRPPTTDANLTVAMAGIFFVMCMFWAVRYNGVFGLVKHVFGVKVEANKYAIVPLFLLFIFIGVMESFSILFIRPVALALRLYGNIFGGETMLTMAMSQKSVAMAVLLALPGYFFETVVCILQAFVFAMLSVAFVGTLCSHTDEEHSH